MASTSDRVYDIRCLDCGHVEVLTLTADEAAQAAFHGKCLKCKGQRLGIERKPL